MTFFKHADDDGELSVITSGNEVLIACTGGHYWVLNAPLQEADDQGKKADDGPAREGIRTVAHGQSVVGLEKFGPMAARAMRAR